MSYNISFIKPSFPDPVDIADDYKRIVESNWFTNFGPNERLFSEACAEYIAGDVHATTIANCTLGLEAAMAILFDSGKKKVILPSFTFAAGAEAIIRSGFEPVFIDINESSWQPSLMQAATLIENHKEDIAGVLLCNVFGVGNKDVGDWELLAKDKGLPLVIDSAAGFGSQYSDSENVGARGDCEVFSMHATKPFAIGEGGLVTSRNSDFIEQVRIWQNFGFDRTRTIKRIGTNAKLQEINAAIGLRQLVDYSARLKSRREVLLYYKKHIGDGYSYQLNDEYSTVPFMSVIAQDEATAGSVRRALALDGIEARQYYEPLHKQQSLKMYIDEELSLSTTDSIASRIISLPVHDSMNNEILDKIVTVMRNHEA